MPRSPESAGYQAAIGDGRPASLWYQGCWIPGSPTSGCGTETQGGSSGLFARIKKSSSGKIMCWMTIIECNFV